MNRFDLIKKYNQKYTQELDKSIELIKPKLIEAFTNIYGIKHYEYIKNTINDLNYIYFISEKFLESLLTYNIKKEERKTILNYLEHIKYLNDLLMNIELKDLEKFIIKNYITKSGLENDILLDYNIIGMLEYDCPIFSLQLNVTNGQLINYIMLPIFSVNIEIIIHEINHALNSNVVGYTEEEIYDLSLFKTTESEELVNDYIANIVLEEYIKIGGVIPKSLKRFDIVNGYKENDYIVKYLYELLSPVFLESLISKKFNLYIKLVGEANHEYLCNLINDLYINGYNETKYIELLDLIDNIYERIINTEFIDYELYIKKLEENGYRIRKIN